MCPAFLFFSRLTPWLRVRRLFRSGVAAPGVGGYNPRPVGVVKTGVAVYPIGDRNRQSCWDGTW
jgi:hypothetical protein